MNKLDLPADVIAKLRAVNGPTKVYDATGEPQAVVLPPELYQQMLDAWADKVFGPPGPPPTAAEIAEGVTTAEAVAYLRELVAKRRGAA
ncbi:MAG: hypothetical protein K2X87_04310 [Gemmataceae bacterium]|nr:hypothetical protein [Gemmataceae bacterium]